jgi:hypothetical protein
LESATVTTTSYIYEASDGIAAYALLGLATLRKLLAAENAKTAGDRVHASRSQHPYVVADHRTQV